MAEIPVPVADWLDFDRLDLSTPSQVNRSTWTGRRKVVGLSGAETWQGKVSLSGIATEEEERQWRAFLFNLAGPENHFRWPLPCNSHIGPRPQVDTGATDGYTLPLTGGQPNARILRAGQFMTVPLPSGHSRTVCLTADLRFDASGDALAQFRPALNEAPTAGVTVETTDPFIPMAPTAPVIGLSLDNGVSGTSFDVEEAM